MVPSSAAVRLFLERVRDVEPGFRLTARNSATVTSICRRLDALPLALELAAPWMKVLSPQELLRRLCDNALPAPVGVRDLPERQQTMNATVAWSCQLLSPAEQRLFRRLGVLPGKFSIDAAAAVLAGDVEAAPAHDDVLRTAATLIDKSLLLRAESSVPSRPLYEMLETVRAFAVLEASVHGERESALTGLARYCAGQARASAEGLVGHAQGEWLDRVRDDLENYRTAFGWLIERGRVVEATEIAFNLLFFWVIRGHAWQGLDWYERQVAKAVNTSTFYFCKMLKKVTGINFTDYLSRVRIEKSKNLLLNPNLRVSEIAFEVGFQSLTHFNRVFKKILGQSPTEYRAQLLGH